MGIPKGVLGGLSPLEAEVISAMAPGTKMKVREIHAVVARKHKAPLTSIAVMLDRLYSKKLVDRKIETCRGGTRYLYFLKKSHEQMEEDYLKAQVDSIITRFGDSAVAYFHKRFSGKK
ncbi:MAG: BlaI/MecI/CopY family transcriptional regulator [Candidatus Anstonellaceae archaeon]